MNKRMIFYMLSQLIKTEALFMVLPMTAAIIYGEWNAMFSFIITIVSALVFGFVLSIVSKPKDKIIYAHDGFVMVALSWLALSFIGALPFVISGEIPSFTDAFFETVSGFTTTGSSIVTNIEGLTHGILFWRSFTHWLGGMGVLVFVMAVIPSMTDRSMHILRAEMPGPVVGKLVPRAKQTAKILYLIYIAFTLAEIILLWAGGMDLFDSLVHTFGTAGTGGLGIRSNSIAGYSPYSQWVITVFMALFGVNFNLYYLLLIKRFKEVLKSRELWCYASIMIFSAVTVAINIYPLYNDVSLTARNAAFQVSSIMTTTGFSTVDFNLWPVYSKSLLLILMFIGGCAGSTAGGLKVSRIVITFKLIRREIKHLVHPREVSKVRMEGKTVDEETLNSVSNYFMLYMIILFLSFLLVSLMGDYDFETNFTSVVACFNNIGPGFGKIVGPAGNYAGFTDGAKYVLSLAMLLGRLEIYPLLMTVSLSAWKRNRA